MKPQKGLTVAVVSDLHVNLTVGLCPPVVALDDGGSHHPSPGQRWLWRCWQDYIEKVKVAAKGRDLYVVVAGDALDMDAKGRSYQIVTKNPATVLRMAADSLAPLTDLADRVWVVRGTEAHAGKSASMEEALARDFRNAVKSFDDTASWWLLLAEWRGVLFEISHHATGDGREWTTNAAMVRQAKETVLHYTESGRRVPQLVLRGHTHQYRDSHDASPLCRAITLPAWTFATAHVHRLGRGAKLADVGGLIVRVDAGRYTVEPVRYRPDGAGAYRVWRDDR